MENIDPRLFLFLPVFLVSIYYTWREMHDCVAVARLSGKLRRRY